MLAKQFKIHTFIKRIFLFFLVFFIPLQLFCQEEESTITEKLHTIVIDAGHGGKDPGAQGKHANEKDIALKIALKLGYYIEREFPNLKVIYTRKTDVFVPLYRRAEIANEAKAQLFISIHVDGVTSNSAYGTSSLVLGLHRANENFEVAKRENSVILLENDHSTRYENFDPESPESYIIFSLMQNLYLTQSIEFASYVQKQFKTRASRKDRGVKQQGLLVLAQTSMPGVLVETGFISNPKEEAYLSSAYGQDIIASAIFRAFRDYKNNIESKSVFTQENNLVLQNTKEMGQTEETPPIVEQTDNTKVNFRVQISSSIKKISVNDNFFQGIENIERIKNNGTYKYVVGNETDYNKIKELCSTIKQNFPDAFIIAVKNDQIITITEALKEINN